MWRGNWPQAYLRFLVREGWVFCFFNTEQKETKAQIKVAGVFPCSSLTLRAWVSSTPQPEQSQGTWCAEVVGDGGGVF